MQTRFQEVTKLLKELISTPSFSREEENTAQVIIKFIASKNISFERNDNNIWVKNLHFQKGKPVILLNSHHDTVKPNKGYTLNPFEPKEINGKLYGLGSNDAGGPLMALLAAFLFFYEEKKLPFNLIWAATAEEEISGKNGIASILGKLGDIHLAIVGEPTQMHLAIAEKGLMVLDCTVHGKAGHAARNEGENAIYKALDDIAWFQSFKFPKESEMLGPVKMAVTVIEAGKQHNVVPDQCKFTVDVRTTDAYSNQNTLDIIKENISAEVQARSTRLNPSGISISHPLVKIGEKLGRKSYGSPTLSDQALMPFPSIKIGPGDSARSHTADEFIYLKEIEEGIQIYIEMLTHYFKQTLENQNQ